MGVNEPQIVVGCSSFVIAEFEMQGKPLVNGFADVPPFDQAALITALRTDQAGESSLPEFLAAAWQAGVVRYFHPFPSTDVLL